MLLYMILAALIALYARIKSYVNSSVARLGVWGLAPMKEKRGRAPLRCVRYRGGRGVDGLGKIEKGVVEVVIIRQG